MKTRLSFLLMLTLVAVTNNLHAQGTAFTYQGRLNDTGQPANGSYDLTFSLFNTSNGVGQISGTLTNTAVAVSNGLFTAILDFGANFPGADRWLEISVCTNGGGSFTTLAPRQHITPSPYAITAMNLSGALSVTQLSGALANSQFANSALTINAGSGLSGGGAVSLGGTTTLSNTGVLSVGANAPLSSSGGPNPVLSLVGGVDAATLGGLNASNFWQLGGNNVGPHQSLGTTNNQALELVVNGVRALRLEPMANNSIVSNAVNVINGSAANFSTPGIYGATVGGGGAANYLGASYPNSVTAIFGTVSGGMGNTSGGNFSTVGGGFQNTANAYIGTVGGGSVNVVSGNAGTIGGGYRNTASSDNSTVSGGNANTASGFEATVGGGFNNTASGEGAFVGGGGSGSFSLLGNIASGNLSVISGGMGNIANNWLSAVGGGYLNFVSGAAATVPGGSNNLALGSTSFAVGNRAQALHDGTFVWADAQSGSFASTAPNQFLIRASGGVGINSTSPGGVLNLPYPGIGSNGLLIGTTNDAASNSFALIISLSSAAAQQPFGVVRAGTNLLSLDTNGVLTVMTAVRSGHFTGDGSGLISLNASQLNSGTVNDSLLSSNVALLAANNAFTGSNYFSGVIVATNAGNVISGAFTGPLSGDVTGTQSATAVASVGGQSAANVASGVSAASAATDANTPNTIVKRDASGNFNAGTITANLAGNANTATTAANVTGSIADAQLSANVALLNGTNLFSGVELATNVNNVLNGTFAGNGGGLTSLNANNLSSGTLADALLSANVALRAGGNSFSGNQTVTNGNVGLGTSTPANQLSVSGNADFSGNVGIGTAAPGNLLVVGGSGSPAYCNGTTWVNGSDRNSKEAFATINPRTVLEKVSALPIQEWKYKVEADGTRHLGPVAQDFHAAFGLNGQDDRHIATVDEEGVALAAIQGLNQKVDDLKTELNRRDAENAELKARLEKLEWLMSQQHRDAE